MTAVPLLRLMAFGSCHLHDPIQILLGEGKCDVIINRHANYTTETHQMIRYYMGLMEMPDEIRNRAMHWPDYPRPNLDFNQSADVGFVEICNPFEIRFEGYFLNRTQLVETVVSNARSRGEIQTRLANDWFNNGILKQNEEVRLQTSAALMELMPEDSEQDRVDKRIVKEAYGYKQTKEDIKAGIIALQNILQKPLIILSHTLNYMPDGRPINWPPGLYRETNEICSELGVPIFNPRELIIELVSQRGREFVLQDDLHHHTPEFHALVAENILTMAQQVATTSIPGPRSYLRRLLSKLNG